MADAHRARPNVHDIVVAPVRSAVGALKPGYHSYVTNPNQTGNVVFASRSQERRYDHPREIVQARRVEDITTALARVERGVAQGLHAAGFLAYEAAPAFDTAFSCHPATPTGLPLLWFGLYDTVHVTRPLLEPVETVSAARWRPLITESAYAQALNRIRELIAAGDTYQVNYTFPLEATTHEDPYAWFRRLCAAQNADFNAYLNLGNRTILSASPELFFRLDGANLETRPMKGTGQRGLWPLADRAAARRLSASPKDRAENLMIVDLLRNDMGRVSEPGSVRARRLFEVERYETVWQMTSTITSWTEASVPAIFGALFPSGSVTGAPKVRAMQIIRELEPFPRGVYCGAIGWWAPGRRAEFSVAIRTVTLEPDGTARYPVGSGVTWDSETTDEFEECLGKARVLTHTRPEFELVESFLFDGAYTLAQRHLDRLGASADYFGFHLDMDAVHTALRTEAARLCSLPPQPWKVRLTLDRHGAVSVRSEPAPLPARLRIALAPEPIDADNAFLYHKTTRRAVYDRARATRPDCDDVILWNRRGELTETTIANLVLELNGELMTPELACGLLGGTMRAELLANGTLRETRLSKADLARATSVRLINSVRSWIDAELVL